MCSNWPVKPGAESMAFVNVHDLVAEMPHSQQVAAVGAANWRLIESGLVKFGDVIGAARVKPFYEVVAEFKLGLKDIIKSGVNKRTAERAYATVHTPAIELARQHASRLVERIMATGLSREQVNRAVGEHFAGKVGIKAGPSGASLPKIGPVDVPKLIEALETVQKAAVSRVAMKAAKPAVATGSPTRSTQARHPNPEISRAIEIAESEGVPAEVPDREFWVKQKGPGYKGVAASYSTSHDKILINADAYVWDNPRIAKQAGDIGYFSSGSRDHVIQHEIGHSKHRHSIGETAYRAIPRDETMPAAMARQVSSYAETNAAEFVAEVYAGLKADRIYPAEIMDKYTELGGVLPVK